MRLGRLALKVYLYSVVMGLATIAVFVASFQLNMKGVEREMPPFPADQLLTDLWKGRAAPRGPFRGPRATVYDLAGKLVASTAPEPAPMLTAEQLAQLKQHGHLELERGLVAQPIRVDGELVGVGIVSLRPGSPPGLFPPGLMWPLAVLAAVFFVATLIFARHVAAPLQQLAGTAKQFGRGELGARSELERSDEIGDLGRAFDDMAERVTHLMSAQQELLVNVSHELLTPMTRIRLAVDLITDGEAAQAKELASEITQDLLELERLIDDVMTVAKLDLSRLEAGARMMPLKPERVPVSELVQKAASKFTAQHKSHEVTLEVRAGLPPLSADTVLLRRVLENLLENARKYSDAGTPIVIRAAATAGGVSIAVSDQGIGIEEADLKKVFTPFFRSDKSRSRTTGGVGLGLALARSVVEAHGGSIDIASKPGSGTTVTLSLPRGA